MPSPGGFGSHHDLGGFPEVPFLLDPLGQLHLPVDLGDLEVRGQVLDQVVQSVLVLGEDQQLLAAVFLQAQVLDHVEKLGQLALCPPGLDLLGEGEQRQQRRFLSFQLSDRVRQPLLQRFLFKLPAGVFVEIVEIVAVGRQRRLEVPAVAQVRGGVLQSLVDPGNAPLQRAPDRAGAGGGTPLHGRQGEARRRP